MWVSSNGNQFTVWILPIKGVREENGIYHLEVVAIDELPLFSSSPLNVDLKYHNWFETNLKIYCLFLRRKSQFITKCDGSVMSYCRRNFRPFMWQNVCGECCPNTPKYSGCRLCWFKPTIVICCGINLTIWSPRP